MIERILQFSIVQRLLVVLVVTALAAFGVRSLQQLPIDAVPVEREVDFLDAVALGARAERRFRARGAAAEQDAVGWCHREQHGIAIGPAFARCASTRRAAFARCATARRAAGLARADPPG